MKQVIGGVSAIVALFTSGAIVFGAVLLVAGAIQRAPTIGAENILAVLLAVAFLTSVLLTWPGNTPAAGA